VEYHDQREELCQESEAGSGVGEIHEGDGQLPELPEVERRTGWGQRADLSVATRPRDGGSDGIGGAEKKIIGDLQEEIQKEVDRIVTLSYRDKERSGHLDLESLEIHIRSAMHEMGSTMLEKLLNSDGGDYRGATLPCDQGHVFEFKEYRAKEILTVLGLVTIQRAYYYDQQCGQGYCPKDRVLQVEETSWSPGVKRIMGKVGTYRPFGLGQEDLQEMAGIEVDGKAIERTCHELGQQAEVFYRQEAEPFRTGKVVPIMPVPKLYICMDATGVPVVKAETVNRRGKAEDGQAKTREAKLGCLFTQTKVNESGFAVRDEDSTSYVGGIETPDVFGNRLYGEALRRGLEKAQKVCVIGDGAPWIWNIVQDHFWKAIQIIDLYHARQHYWNAARAVLGSDREGLKRWTQKRRKELDRGKVEKVIEAIGSLCPSTQEQEELVAREKGYFDKNKERMRYEDFRKQGLFVGSGVIEAGCRTVIGQRLKQSGMHWTVKGANSLIALRCCILSGRWEDFWEYRATG